MSYSICVQCVTDLTNDRVINRLCDNDSNQDNSRPELHNQSVNTLTFTQTHLNQCLTDPGSHIMSLNIYIRRSREQFKEVSVISF